jgi:hypothetical protein
MTNTEQLVIGQAYTPAQACALTGGGQHQGFITSRDGQPLALFGKVPLNPAARQGVYAIERADSPRSIPLLERWLRSGAALPVFWWRGPNRWEYAGRWCPVAKQERGPLFEQELARARHRGRTISWVLVTARVGQE